MTFARAALGSERTNDLRLEEIESTMIGGEDAWLITLSMTAVDPPGSVGGAFAAVLGKGKREYKTFTVLKRDGEVKSMKIRELADA